MAEPVTLNSEDIKYAFTRLIQVKGGRAEVARLVGMTANNIKLIIDGTSQTIRTAKYNMALPYLQEYLDEYHRMHPSKEINIHDYLSKDSALPAAIKSTSDSAGNPIINMTSNSVMRKVYKLISQVANRVADAIGDPISGFAYPFDGNWILVINNEGDQKAGKEALNGFKSSVAAELTPVMYDPSKDNNFVSIIAYAWNEFVGRSSYPNITNMSYHAFRSPLDQEMLRDISADLSDKHNCFVFVCRRSIMAKGLVSTECDTPIPNERVRV